MSGTPGAFGKQNDPNAPSKTLTHQARRVNLIKPKIVEDDHKRPIKHNMRSKFNEACDAIIRWIKKYLWKGGA